MPNSRHGIDVEKDDNDARFIDRDYSIGGGVSMIRKDFEHGFGSSKEIVKSGGFQNLKVENKTNGKSGFFGKGPKNWKKDDSKIRDDVCERLFRDSYLDASEIEVSVKDGIVNLVGWVNSREEKLEALREAYEVVGVIDVDNNLYIKNRLIE